jgi:hypothetical protein
MVWYAGVLGFSGVDVKLGIGGVGIEMRLREDKGPERMNPLGRGEEGLVVVVGGAGVLRLLLLANCGVIARYWNLYHE